VREKRNRINPRWRSNKKEKRTSITMVLSLYLSFATFPTPLVSHRSDTWSDVFLASTVHKKDHVQRRDYVLDANFKK
jgi:hypothetical protein